MKPPRIIGYLLFGLFSVLVLAACAAAPTGNPGSEETPSRLPPTSTMEPTALAASPEILATPATPPSGPPVVVAFVKDGDGELWDEATNQTRTIFSAGDVVAVWLSDDGQLIAFTRRSVVQLNDVDWFEQSALWVVGSNGENARELVSAEDLRQRLNAGETDSTDIAQVAWAPHTHRLIYSGIKYFVQGEGQSHALPEGVYLVDADTRSEAVLAPAGGNYRFVASPDGQQIALMSTTSLGFVNVDGSYRRQDILTYPRVGVPISLLPTGVWTRAAHAFLIVAPLESESVHVLNYSILRVPLDGSPARSLATITDTHGASVTFSPNGQQAAFYRWQGGPPEVFNWFITPLSAAVGSLTIPHHIDLGYANLHWSPAGVAYVINDGALSQLCPDAAQDTEVCGEPIDLGGTIGAIHWMDSARFLFLTREPYGLFFGNLDGTKFPIVTWSPEEASQSFDAALLEPPSPSPAGPTPTPDLAMMTVDVRISASPDGQWKAEALLANPYNPQGTAVGEKDYARLTVYRTDGSQKWTPYEEWSETGLGDSFLSETYWSADGRYLYFAHRGNADGCGTPFVTNLRQVDLGDGIVSEIPLTGLGLDVITISPDAGRMAYRTEGGILIHDLESGETRTLPYQWPQGFDHLVGGYAWSPDGRELAFIITEGFCGPPENSRTSIWVIKLETGEVHTLTEQDYGALLPETDPVSTPTFVLQDYLNRLSWGRSDMSSYEWAAGLYGGSYETLIEMNPDIDSNDHAALLRSACQLNGFQCLRLREVLSVAAVVGENGAQEFCFTVNLMNPDGSVFALGPCCGEEAAGEPQTVFLFTVRQMEDGAYKVLDLPPYMP